MSKSSGGKKRFACPKCDYSTDYKWHLTRHELLHTGEKPFSCTICAKSFRDSSNLKEHMQIHSDEKHPCDACNKIFKSKATLRKHQKNFCGEKQFSCSECDKTFFTQRNLDDHERSHRGEKPFTCDICNKSFGRKDYLNNHKKFHERRAEKMKDTEKKKYSCSLCDYSCSDKLNYMVHQRRHNGEDPYSCSKCAKSFAHKYNYVDHTKVHTLCENIMKSIISDIVEMPPLIVYECSSCRYPFRSAKALSIHWGECFCTSCKISFCTYDKAKDKIKSVLSKHLSQSTKFTCQICRQTVDSCYDLMKHKQEMHRTVQNAVNQQSSTNKMIPGQKSRPKLLENETLLSSFFNERTGDHVWTPMRQTDLHIDASRFVEQTMDIGDATLDPLKSYINPSDAVKVEPSDDDPINVNECGLFIKTEIKEESMDSGESLDPLLLP